MKRLHTLAGLGTCLWVAGIASGLLAHTPDQHAISPQTEVLYPFNGRNLDGWVPWHQATQQADPHHDYRVTDGMLHIGGRGLGYLATKQAYRDYHLHVEYRWGERTDGSGQVRNSGVLLHATGPEGNARGVWMASIECQLAQGCEGDLIVIRGQAVDGAEIPVRLRSRTRTAADGRTRWDPTGQPTDYRGKQFWWSDHEVGFRERLDTRGAQDVASPVGEWTSVDCICDGDRITIKINGVTVNECYDVEPSAGRILLENENNEIYFRNLEIRPLTTRQPQHAGADQDVPSRSRE